MKTLMIALMTFGLAQTLPASDSGIEFGEAGYGGKGCEQGKDIYLTADEDGSIISYYPEAWVFAGQGSGKTLDRATCNLALPFKLEAGKKLVIQKQEQLGFAAVTASAQARLKQEVFTAGATGPAIDEVLKGEVDNFRKFNNTDLVTACGETGILRVNSAVTAVARGADYSLVGLEQVKLRFKVVDCAPAPTVTITDSGSDAGTDAGIDLSL